MRELPGLEWLVLHDTSISDDGLKHLAGCQSLILLPLGSTKITDAGLAHLKGLVNLKSLNLATG